MIQDFEEMFPASLGKHQKIYPGYGSEQGFRAFKDWSSTKEGKVIVDLLLHHIRNNATTDELVILGLYKDTQGDVRVLINDRLLDLGDGEHCCCCLYQLLAWTMSHRATNVAQPSQPHCHPSPVEMALNFFSDDTLRIATEALDAFERMVDNGTWPSMPSQLRLRKEDSIRAVLNAIPTPRDYKNLTRPIVLKKKQRRRFRRRGAFGSSNRGNRGKRLRQQARVESVEDVQEDEEMDLEEEQIHEGSEEELRGDGNVDSTIAGQVLNDWRQDDVTMLECHASDGLRDQLQDSTVGDLLQDMTVGDFQVPLAHATYGHQVKRPRHKQHL